MTEKEYPILDPEEWERKRAAFIRRDRARKRELENPESAERAAERKAQRRQTAAERPNIVYRVTFRDGAVYVGCTVQYISTRLAGHRGKCTALGRRLDMTPKSDYIVEALAEFPRDDRAAALEYEKAELEKVPVTLRLNLRSPIEDIKITAGSMNAAECYKILTDEDLAASVGRSVIPKYPHVVSGDPSAEWFDSAEEREVMGG